MNKKLIALAISGITAPTTLMADGVVITGRAAAAVDVVSAKGATAGDALDIPTRRRVTDIASRIRFRGSEDLGRDLKAIFYLEANTPLDFGGGPNATFGGPGTEQYVGLAGKFGDATLGTKSFLRCQ